MTKGTTVSLIKDRDTGGKAKDVPEKSEGIRAAHDITFAVSGVELRKMSGQVLLSGSSLYKKKKEVV
jgi:hypothetical protein